MWPEGNPLYTTDFKHGTCKQSRDVLTTRGDLDWQASSNGRKYLSASMKFAFGGATVPSLGKEQERASEGKLKKKKKKSLLFLHYTLNCPTYLQPFN